ncbi:efflux RND transporter permease subunit [bacterium]|nr:MAG: efflux RND transporter permease subunit [bacterium]
MSNQNNQTVDDRKEYKLSSFSIDNAISVLVMLFLITIIGIRSYLTIPKEAQPDITIPNIIVISLYPGVAPEDMESLITQKIEDKLNEIADIKKMSSTSTEGYSSINIEFETSVNIDEALQKVREKVDLAKPDLPAAAEEPIIQEINFSEFPIMQVNLSGQYSLDRLKKIAENVKDRIEGLPSVLEVDMAGELEREVKIDVDLPRLKYFGLSFGDVIKAVQVENVTIPGGSIEVGSKKFLVRIPGEYKDPSKLENIVVKANSDNPIYLRDVANVDFGFKDRESYARLDGDPVITLSVKKRTGENIIQTTADVKAIIADESENFPPTTNVKITSELSKNIEDMVANLENSIISGLILVIGVLLFFLGVKNASFVGISIPLSMFLSFIILLATGITMNMVVLFSLILALGMLVDNAIVVVENIYRYLEEGYDNITAAKKGTGEVAIPIISGTLTTLAAFFPMAFWPGIVGEFMGFLPKTLIVTLSSSLFIGLVINPVLCAKYMTLEGVKDDKPGMTRNGKITLYAIIGLVLLVLLFSMPVIAGMGILTVVSVHYINKYAFFPISTWWQTKGLNDVVEKYENSLKWALKHPIFTLGISVGTFVLAFMLFGAFPTPVEFFPEGIPPKQLYVQVEGPVGTSVEKTDEVIQIIEKRLKNIPNYEDVESVVATSGKKISGGFGGGGASTHLGTVVVSFKDYTERVGDTFEALEWMRSNLDEGIVGATIVVEKQQNGPPTGKPVNVELSGTNMDELERISAILIKKIENDPVYSKLEGLDTDLPDARPELRVIVDREKAAKYGLSTNVIGSTVRQAVNGVEASKYRDGKDEYDITVRVAEQYRKDLSSLGELNVMADKGRQIPLSEIATWYVDESFGGIKRIDMNRVISIGADVRSGFTPNDVLKEVQALLSPYEKELPKGYKMTWTGQNQEQQKAQEFLANAFLIAMFLIAFILISQFNSLIKPVIILTSVMMSTAGVFYGMVILRMPFVVIMTGIGIVSLAGVVVNNAIVLIDYIDVLRFRDKLSLRESLVKAGSTRFRPVILTAVTTVLGLIPLAIGFNFDFLVLYSNPIEFFTNIGQYVYYGGEQAAWWSAMATAVIVGLSFATAITLILVPVLYLTFDSINMWLTAFFKGKEYAEAKLVAQIEGVTIEQALDTTDVYTNGNGHSYEESEKPEYQDK